jgi:hypothetical protein
LAHVDLSRILKARASSAGDECAIQQLDGFLRNYGYRTDERDVASGATPMYPDSTNPREREHQANGSWQVVKNRDAISAGRWQAIVRGDIGDETVGTDVRSIRLVTGTTEGGDCNVKRNASMCGVGKARSYRSGSSVQEADDACLVGEGGVACPQAWRQQKPEYEEAG